ncbi:MAG TPA: hypothetical protein QF802_00695 [Candidatus Thalassarchaeaceae archaeon]|nr:hypothetical protein [Candidatus Thalassarchaeaceae archaeon]
MASPIAYAAMPQPYGLPYDADGAQFIREKQHLDCIALFDAKK